MVKLLVTELWALSLAMLPALVALCVLHLALFDNPESLEWLVTQATMTLVGNFTLGSCLVDLAFHPVCR